MIALISGVLKYKSPSHVVVDVHGVGYRLFVPLTTFYELPDPGQAVALNVHTHVKQDGINLFGFHTPEERDIFQLLLAVTGIGPKLAVNILSGIAAGELRRAVSQGNLRRLIAIPGVGKKMAERIILELRDKVLKLAATGVESEAPAESPQDELINDALSALVNLGYRQQAAKEALDRACREAGAHLTLDLLLKDALKALAGQ